MASINHHYLKLKAGYLFPEISRRVSAFTEAHPETSGDLIRCGIGDVTEPLPLVAREAMHAAIDDLGTREGFHGYGPEQGYPFLREAIANTAYADKGIDVAAEEIFVSDGSKCDTANMLDILGPDNSVAVQDPVYPVYVDTNVMAGHTGEADASGRYQGLTYLPCTADNSFMPQIPSQAVDLIYLCSPNNPTGAAASRDELAAWVDYANRNGSLILFDAAYEAFISSPGVPHSIYEIPGAETCAIEFKSFSKQGGFTGVRCAYTVVPKALSLTGVDGAKQPLHPLWNRRFSTKFNGVSYVTQQGAAALLTERGQVEVKELIAHYLENARILKDAVASTGLVVYGGVDAPYIWVKGPGGMTSWEMFDHVLSSANIVITPGSGFGAAGEGYFRISAFNSRENAVEAARRLQQMSWEKA